MSASAVASQPIVPPRPARLERQLRSRPQKQQRPGTFAGGLLGHESFSFI